MINVHRNSRQSALPSLQRNVREDAYSRTWGIFIRDTAYFIVIQWSMTLCFIESQWNEPYPVWKYLTYVRSLPTGGKVDWGLLERDLKERRFSLTKCKQIQPFTNFDENTNKFYFRGKFYCFFIKHLYTLGTLHNAAANWWYSK